MDSLLNKYNEKYLNYQRKGNWLEDLNPLTKANILFVLSLTPIVVQDYRYGLILCVFYYIIAAVFGKLKEFNKTFLKLVFVIGVVIILIRQITHRVENPTILFSIFGWDWSLEALEEGLRLGTLMLGFSGAIILFFEFTEIRDLMYSLEQKGVSHTASYIMLSSFQTIIDLQGNAVTILESQKSRGIETDGGVLSRVKALIPVISPLLLGAISSSEEKFVAMDARAFSVNRKHTFLRELQPVPNWEKTLVIFVDICFVLLVVAKIYFSFFA